MTWHSILNVLSGFDPVHLGLLIAISFCGAFVRGYTGFGMSAIVITGASIFMSPRELIPVMWAMELSATIVMLPKVWRDVDFKFVAALVIGTAALLPIGQKLLLTLPADNVRAVVAVVVAVGAIGTLAGLRWGIAHGLLYGVIVGMVFGLISGIAAVGGLIASLIIVATSAEYERSRASMVMLFAAGPMMALPLGVVNGVVTDQTLPLYLMLLPLLVVGVWLGGRFFASSDINKTRRRIMWLILGLAIAILARLLIGI